MLKQTEQVELFRAVEVHEMEERRELHGYSSFLEELFYASFYWWD